MLKYFQFPTQSIGGIYITKKEKTAEEINKYAEENNLKIVQISVCNDIGIFVVFEKLN